MDANTLKGAKLRKAVAEAIGWKVYREDMGGGKLGAWICEDPTGLPYSLTRYGFAPDLNWAQAGPLIEREKLMIEPKVDMGVYYGEWRAVGLSWEGRTHADCTGPTPLVAAMRALVASIGKASNVRAKGPATARKDYEDEQQ